MSPGPWPGSSPLAKTIGKIAKPEAIATKLSNNAIVRTVEPMFALLGTYEP